MSKGVEIMVAVLTPSKDMSYSNSRIYMGGRRVLEVPMAQGCLSYLEGNGFKSQSWYCNQESSVSGASGSELP